jgi:hypothetical protein
LATVDLTGVGGAVLGGITGITLTSVHLPTGGFVAGGAATIAAFLEMTITMVGGIVLGGGGSPTLTVDLTMSGGAVVHGHGKIGPYYNPTPTTAEALAAFSSGAVAATYAGFDAADLAEIWRNIRP